LIIENADPDDIVGDLRPRRRRAETDGGKR
jgi:hypothetical protein